MNRIYYLCPDFPHPSAGILRLYRHVEHLNRLGFHAAIIHEKRGCKLSWHGYTVPTIWLEDQPCFQDKDILVIPEGMSNLMKQTRHFSCTRVVIALNWAYIYTGLPKQEDWTDYGITEIITPSPYIKQFLEWSMGVQVTLIDNFVDTVRFSYQPHRKKNKIAYMSRKDGAGEILHRIFEKKFGSSIDHAWIHLHDLTLEQYALQLAESRIFLATSREEGMPTSILEAMASGCLVVGYAGLGGNDYMVGCEDNQNCVLVENGNYLQSGKIIEQIICDDIDRSVYDTIIKNAVQTASCFGSFEKEGQSLKKYYQKFF